MIKISVKLASGQVIEEILEKDVAVLGRSTKSDVVIADEALSRSHCQIEYDGENFYITDLGSANGVLVNGKKISPNDKIQFSSFEEVLLGPHEVTVSYEDRSLSAIAKKTATKSTQVQNAEKTKLHRPPPPKREVKKKSPLINVVAFLVVTGAAVYQFKFKENTVEESKESTSSNIPAGVNLPDSFLTSTEYASKDDLKTCSGEFESACKELALKQDSGEGILKEGQQVFLFIRPQNHYELPKFSKIKELDDRDSLITLYLALKSPQFESFRKKEVLQIHLIMKDSDSKSKTVFRFHTKYFTSSGPEKARLTSELISIFEGSSSNVFWADANPIIQKQDL